MNNKELYFIPILIKAFEKEDLESSIESAISEIKILGKLEENRIGYKQFRMFLKSGIIENQRDNYLDRILYEIVHGSIPLTEIEKDNVLKKIESNEELSNRYKKIIAEFGAKIPLEIEVFKDEKLLKAVLLEDDKNEISFIEAGQYKITLNNGRVLWEGEITDQDIMLDSNKRNNYKMVASTEDIDREPTKSLKLMNNELMLFVYAGLEYGKFRFVFNEKL